MEYSLIARENSESLRYRSHPKSKCKICESTAMPFDLVDLLKQCEAPLYPDTPSLIPVIYHRCGNCGFIFTTYFDEFDEEMWCKHIYNTDYIKVDPEYEEISCLLSKIFESIVHCGAIIIETINIKNPMAFSLSESHNPTRAHFNYAIFAKKHDDFSSS